MLQELAVKNFGLIEELKISFQSGLHVITGETGAGKSMIIDALNVIVGGRASSDLVRHGYESAYIEAMFTIPATSIPKLADVGIEIEDNELIISREIKVQGKSTCRINGKLIPVQILREIMEPLVDIHGQHEHQKLLHAKEHLKMVDGFGKTTLSEQLELVSQAYVEYSTLCRQLQLIQKNEQDVTQRTEFLKYQIQDINQLKLIPEEEKELEAKKKILNNQEKITKNAHQITMCINTGVDEGYSACGLINQAMQSMQELAKIDSKYNAFLNILATTTIQLDELAFEVSKILELESTEENVNAIESRLFELQQAKRKYNKNIEELIDYKQQLERELFDLENRDSILLDLQDRVEEVKRLYTKKAEELSALRKKVSLEMEKILKSELKQLSLPNVQFEVDFKEAKEPHEKGFDIVEFLFSANLGEPVRPLAKIASGGEMSRIMLAFKNLLANVDRTPTVIFDEVDAGVSGQAAQRIAEKLAQISKNRQIFCVTHLPQIAAMSDVHLFIKKDVIENKTVTSLEILRQKEIVDELGRMISGQQQISQKTRDHAIEMREIALKFKKNG